MPIALSGYRPRVDFGLTPSLIAVRNLMFAGDTQSATLRGYTAQLQIKQTLFNGFKTGNQVRQAEASYAPAARRCAESSSRSCWTR